VLQPHYYVLQERKHRAWQTTLLSYFKKKYEVPLTDQRTTEEDTVGPADIQPGHPSRQKRLHIFILLQNKCDINSCTSI
jgi:hypothetical protein